MSLSWTGWVTLISLFVGIAIIVWGIRDVLSYSKDEFAAAGRTRHHWVIVQLVLGPVATFMWFATARFDVRDPSRLDDPMLLTDEMPKPW